MSTEYHLEFRRLVTGRILGVAVCQACTWCASLLDDTAIEVDAFLHGQCVTHAREQHPEQFTDEDAHAAPCPGPR